MNLKVWLKAKGADRVLAPLRKELVELMEKDASVLEIGCGTGDLIFQSSEIISRGLGVDLDNNMIEYADEKKRERGLNHISFKCMDASELKTEIYDISTSTLCIHEMVQDKACKLLKMMVENSNKVLIADYTAPKTLSGKLGIEFDEMISGHYGNFKKYRKSGEIPFYAGQVGAKIHKVIPSSIDGISLWILGRNC